MNGYEEIYAVVRQIPAGRVCTYGLVAVLAGRPGHARQVGYALHALRGSSDVPWWRVINRNGFISNPYAAEQQSERLRAEGVAVSPGQRVDLERFLWAGAGPEADGDGPAPQGGSQDEPRLQGGGA